ncbi:MAG: hypothetical protein ACXV5H_10085 [Halobacteriota archaeon]
MTEGDLWERLPGESAKAYDAFRCYRDMGPKRSIAKVARAMGCSTGLLKRWSSPYRWVARAMRYDDYLDKRLREARERVVLETAAKHAELARTAQERALLRLSAIDVDSLRPTQLLQFTKASIELEAAAYRVR